MSVNANGSFYSFYHRIIDTKVLHKNKYIIFKILKRDRKKSRGIVKKISIFFSNYVPSEVAFSRLSENDCTKPFCEIRPGTRFFELKINFGPYIVPSGRTKRVPGRISKNGLVQSISRSLENSTSKGT